MAKDKKWMLILAVIAGFIAYKHYQAGQYMVPYLNIDIPTNYLYIGAGVLVLLFFMN